ncbi:hypothetical protein JOM56_004975, partial [Amanita muscaria]
MLGGLTLLLSVASAAHGSMIPQLDGYNSSFAHACNLISSSIPQESRVYYPGTAVYERDIYHWASSSTQHSTCTVEPGSVQDIANILQIVGQTRTPFGVKSGGGHTMNPNFSSSPGVLIALCRFNGIEFDPASQTVTFGTGLRWDDVYAALAPYNVSVLGARFSGVGVGHALGGGYSWKTNQYGLALDTITALELVKPDGRAVTVTEESDSELFFGLKGGFNNFGIVTRITMQTFPQTSVWGGQLTYPASSMSAVTAAVIKYSATNTDPKATIDQKRFLTSYHHLPFLDMPTNPVVRASSASYGRFSDLSVDSLEDITVPPTPVITTVPISQDFVNQMSTIDYTKACIDAVFNKKTSGFHRAQSLYAAFIELASELETTSHFNNVMTRIAENLATLGCKTEPCTLHCDKSHFEPCTLEHATPCTLSHAEPCTLEHAQPCMLSHADPCTLPHFFVTPQPCTLSHADPCNRLHIDPCTLSHAEPCTLSHAEPCTLNHFPVEPVTVAVTIPCPLAHNDPCTKEHVIIPIASPLPDALKMPTGSNRQHKRKRFKTKKINDKLIRM